MPAFPCSHLPRPAHPAPDFLQTCIDHRRKYGAPSCGSWAAIAARRTRSSTMILIVEDHADARQALVKLIKRVGHDVIGVADGAQALLFLQTTLPQLIILDYDMPNVDGLEVLHQLRADPRTAAVPVVFFTAASSGLMRATALAAGAQEYIRKGSMDWMQIVACIERY